MISTIIPPPQLHLVPAAPQGSEAQPRALKSNWDGLGRARSQRWAGVNWASPAEGQGVCVPVQGSPAGDRGGSSEGHKDSSGPSLGGCRALGTARTEFVPGGDWEVRTQKEVTLQEQHRAQQNEPLGFSLILHRINEVGNVLQDHPVQTGTHPHLVTSPEHRVSHPGVPWTPPGDSRPFQSLTTLSMRKFSWNNFPKEFSPRPSCYVSFSPSPEPFPIQSNSGSSF